MPLRRRRPLLRAAAVGGTAYAAGRHSGRRAEAEQYGAPAQEPVYQQPPPPAAAPAAPTSEADRISALRDLKELLDSGAITQADFDSEKDRLLHGS